jgi:prophage antirepressor-like protein
MKIYDVAGKHIRGFEENGELWFVGQDIAKALGMPTTSQQWNLEDHEKGLAVIATKGGPQAMKTVSAAGLISLLFRSKQQQAVELRKWVYSLIVPYLRLRITEAVMAGVDPREEREARRSGLRACGR